MGILLLKLALQNLLFFGLHFEGKNMFPKQLSSKEEADCIKEIAEGNEQWKPLISGKEINSAHMRQSVLIIK